MVKFSLMQWRVLFYPDFSIQANLWKAIWLPSLCHQTMAMCYRPSGESNLQELYHCYLESRVFTVVFTKVPLYWAYLEMVWRSNSSLANSRKHSASQIEISDISINTPWKLWSPLRISSQYIYFSIRIMRIGCSKLNL